MRQIASYIRDLIRHPLGLDESANAMVSSNKVMIKQKSKVTSYKKLFKPTAIAIICAVLVMSPANVFADRYDDEINNLRAEISNYSQQAANLRSQADTLQNALNAITAEKNVLQGQIDLNQSKSEKLAIDITANEEKLDRQKRTLNKTVAQIYANGDITPIVMLASAKNVGEYISAQEVRGSVRDQMKEAMDQVKVIKAELAKQKAELDRVIADQNNQKMALATKEAEQASLVERTRGEEAAYQNLVSQRRGDVERLQNEQQASYAAARASWGGGYISSGGSGSYPYAGAPYPCWSYGCADPWGLYYRECVSYVAWRLDNQGYGVNHFNGRGYATQWPSTTSYYTSQSSSPSRGAAGVNPYIGAYDPEIGMKTGHVAYVEEVYGNGDIRITEYNFAGPGKFSERRITPGGYSGWTFIQFPRQ